MAPPIKIHDIKDNFKRDIDLIRPMVFNKEETLPITCTLHEEIKPPAYRYVFVDSKEFGAVSPHYPAVAK